MMAGENEISIFKHNHEGKARSEQRKKYSCTHPDGDHIIQIQSQWKQVLGNSHFIQFQAAFDWTFTSSYASCRWNYKRLHIKKISEWKLFKSVLEMNGENLYRLLTPRWRKKYLPSLFLSVVPPRHSAPVLWSIGNRVFPYPERIK